jgi:hypothetical protein
MRSLGPREREALRLVQQHPGITVMDLADELGVTVKACLGNASVASNSAACDAKGHQGSDQLFVLWGYSPCEVEMSGAGDDPY